MWSEKLHERYLMINEKIKIEDNFLDLAEFNKIQELMMGPSSLGFIVIKLSLRMIRINFSSFMYFIKRVHRQVNAFKY